MYIISLVGRKSFIGVACTHNIDDVLNPSYVPHTVEETEVFAAKQKFAFSILDHKLQRDFGKLYYTNIIMLILMHKFYVKNSKSSTKAQIVSFWES
jgi:hypothetical protein